MYPRLGEQNNSIVDQQDHHINNSNQYRQPMETLQCSTEGECEEWYNVFCSFDSDNDGFIPLRELRNAITMSAAQFGLSRDEAEYLLEALGPNRESWVDFPQFTYLMYRAKRMHLRRFMLQTARSVLPRSQQVEAARYMLEYNCWPPPFFVVLVSILQLSFYIYHQFEFCGAQKFSASGCSPTSSLLILNPCRKLDFWRYLSYMFVHVGYVHVFTNLCVQLMLGVPLELVHKWWRIALIYMIGVVTGALLFFVFDRNIFLAGASSGGYTLLSAHISNVILNWDEMDFNWVRAGLLLILVGTDAGTSAYQRYFTDRVNKVSFVSHLGGFIAGLFLGIVILRNLRKLRWERYAWWFALISFVCFFITCIAIVVVQELTLPKPPICLYLNVRAGFLSDTANRNMSFG